MTMTVGEGGGGGSTSSMCAINPADEVGIIGNLIDRIKELEKAVSQLLAVNVMANQLSDISQQVGWVYNITYMGQPGWTQTEAGTLIPPPGVSLSSLGLLMSDGNPYPFVSMDSDGVLQFGFDSDGIVQGEQPTAWSGGGSPDYAYFSLAPDVTETRGITITNNTFVINEDGTYNAQIRFVPSKSGLYLVNSNIQYYGTGAASGTAIGCLSEIRSGPGQTAINWNFGFGRIKTLFGSAQNFGPVIADGAYISTTALVRVTAANQVVIVDEEAVAYPSANMPADYHFSNVFIRITRLGPLA